MKIEKPIRVYSEFLNSLNRVKGQMLFDKHTGTLFYINDYKIEVRETVVKHLIGKDTIKKKTYLTEIQLWGWNPQGQFWGTFDQDSISMLTWKYDLIYCRKNYIECIANAYNKLGYEVTKIPKKEEPCTATENKN